MDETTEELERGNEQDSIVPDFEKAFDKVSHTLLGHKLRRHRIGGQLNAWILQLFRGQAAGCCGGGGGR